MEVIKFDIEHWLTWPNETPWRRDDWWYAFARQLIEDLGASSIWMRWDRYARIVVLVREDVNDR